MKLPLALFALTALGYYLVIDDKNYSNLSTQAQEVKQKVEYL